MSPEAKAAIAGAGIIVITILVVVVKFVHRRAPMKINKVKYQERWKKLQAYCKNKKTWPEALTAADELLDKALIKRGYKGRNMGERLVNAQKDFTDNDSMWFGHKLARKVQEDPEIKLKEKDVKNALLGIGQALKDLGAL